MATLLIALLVAALSIRWPATGAGWRLAGVLVDATSPWATALSTLAARARFSCWPLVFGLVALVVWARAAAQLLSQLPPDHQPLTVAGSLLLLPRHRLALGEPLQVETLPTWA